MSTVIGPTAPIVCPSCGAPTDYLECKMDDVVRCRACSNVNFDKWMPMSEIRREIRAAISELLEPMLLRGGTIKKLRLEPGEILCLFVPGKLSAENHRDVQSSMDALFPNRKCVVFDEGMDLRVLHPEDDEPESDVVDG